MTKAFELNQSTLDKIRNRAPECGCGEADCKAANSVVLSVIERDALVAAARKAMKAETK